MRSSEHTVTYQPPIPKTSQASAWSYMYIGRWMCKTEGSPTGLGKNFVRLNSWKKPLAKVVDFDHLGALSGPEHRIPIWEFLDALTAHTLDTCSRKKPNFKNC